MGIGSHWYTGPLEKREWGVKEEFLLLSEDVCTQNSPSLGDLSLSLRPAPDLMGPIYIMKLRVYRCKC